MLAALIIAVLVYLLVSVPAFFFLQRALIGAFRTLVEFDLDALDPPKVVQLPEGPESGVMIDFNACMYSELDCVVIEEVRNQILDSLMDTIEFRAFRSWSSVKALYAAGHLEDITGGADVIAEDERKERRIVLTSVVSRAPLWPIGVGGALVAWFGAKMFVRQVRSGKF